MAFIDYKKAFDTVSRPKIFSILYENSVPLQIISMLEKLYNNVQLQLIYGSTLLDAIKSTTGVK